MSNEKLTDGDLRALMEMALDEGSGACAMDSVTLGKLVRELQDTRLRAHRSRELSAEDAEALRWAADVGSLTNAHVYPFRNRPIEWAVWEAKRAVQRERPGIDMNPTRDMRCICGHLHAEHFMLDMTDCSVAGCRCEQWGLDDSHLFQHYAEPNFDKWPSELSTAIHVFGVNLRVVGALCAAFAQGYKCNDVERSITFFVLAGAAPPTPWRPGCGHTAPGFDDGKGK